MSELGVESLGGKPPEDVQGQSSEETWKFNPPRRQEVTFQDSGA